jgi:hypothetical protein
MLRHLESSLLFGVKQRLDERFACDSISINDLKKQRALPVEVWTILE